MKNLKVVTFVAGATTIAAILAFIPGGKALAAPPVPKITTTQRTAVLTGVVPGNQGIIDASCLPGETVTGGGFRWGEYHPELDDFGVLIGQQADVARSSQYTAVSPLAWRVVVLNTGSLNIDIEADVMCAKVGF